MREQSFKFGELETRALFFLEEKEISMLTSEDLAKALKISSNRANKLAWQLVKKNRLIRIKKGLYLFAPMRSGIKGHWSEDTYVVLDKLMQGKPYYVSFLTAMHHYGLTEQIPIVVQVVTTSKVNPFSAVGAKFQFIKVRKLGKYVQEKIRGKTINFTTKEQLIIDCLSYPEYCAGITEAAKAIWNAKLNFKDLKTLAKQSKNVIQRRLGYLLEVLKIKESKQFGGKFAGLHWLDPSSVKKEIEISKKWGLRVNLAEKELTYWMET